MPLNKVLLYVQLAIIATAGAQTVAAQGCSTVADCAQKAVEAAQAAQHAAEKAFRPIAAVYRTSTPQVVPTQVSPDKNTTRLNFDQKVRDTQNAVQTGLTWHFTAPLIGVYHVTANVINRCTSGGAPQFVANNVQTALTNLVVYVQPNGSSNVNIANEEVLIGGSNSVFISADVSLGAGDLLWVGYGHDDFVLTCPSGIPYEAHFGIFLAGQ